MRNKIELNTMTNQFLRSAVLPMKAIVASAASAVAFVLPQSASADWKMNLQTPNSAIAQQMFDLHTLITVVCVVIFFGVFGVMFYSLYAHRKSSGRKASQGPCEQQRSSQRENQIGTGHETLRLHPHQ